MPHTLCIRHIILVLACRTSTADFLNNSGKEGLAYPYTFTEDVSIPESFTGDYVLRAAIPYLVGVSKTPLDIHAQSPSDQRLTSMIGIRRGRLQYLQRQPHHLLNKCGLEKGVADDFGSRKGPRLI